MQRYIHTYIESSTAVFVHKDMRVFFVMILEACSGTTFITPTSV